MMTNEQLLKAYVERIKGLKIVKGTSLEILVPYLCLDCVYQFYLGDIRKIRQRNLPREKWGSWFTKLNKLKKEWRENYNSIMGKDVFFDKFTEEEQEAIMDKMDDFEKYIGNYLMMARVAIMKVIDPMELERQQVVASCLLSEVLIWIGMDVWEKCIRDRERPTYERRDGKMVRMVLPDKFKVWNKFEGEYRKMDKLRHTIHKYVNYYYKPSKHITINENPLCTNEIELLCRKIVRFLIDEADKGTKE